MPGISFGIYLLDGCQFKYTRILCVVANKILEDVVQQVRAEHSIFDRKLGDGSIFFVLIYATGIRCPVQCLVLGKLFCKLPDNRSVY